MNRQRPSGRLSLNAVFLTVIVVVFALFALLSVAPLPFFNPGVLGQGIIQLAAVVGAVAVIVGVLNLFTVHVGKVGQFNVTSIYSLFTLVTFVAVLVLHVLEQRGMLPFNLTNTAGEPVVTLTLLEVLQVVIESALAGLLFFFLVYSAYRLMRRRLSIWAVIFTLTLIVVLVGYIMPPGTILALIRDWILRVPVAAGTRGLLIGVAIGTITVGVRVLVGQDRLFRE